MERVFTSELYTKRLYNGSDNEDEQSVVYLYGKPTNLVISGIILEDCMRFYDFYLLFMKDQEDIQEYLYI